MTNSSQENYDTRPITRIIYEKATFGAPPTHFKIDGDPRWHPVSFADNPALSQVKFADQSISYIESDTLTKPPLEDEPIRTDFVNQPANDYVREKLQLDAIEDVFADSKELASLSTEDLSAVSVEERFHEKAEASASAALDQLTRINPDNPDEPPKFKTFESCSPKQKLRRQKLTESLAQVQDADIKSAAWAECYALEKEEDARLEVDAETKEMAERLAPKPLLRPGTKPPGFA